MLTKRYAHLAPVLLRLVLGAVFITHGLPKLLHIGAVAGFFGALGIPAPYVMTILVGLVEVVGGALLLIGYGTFVASVLLAAVMVVAIGTFKISKGFVDGYELETVLLAGILSLALSGPGSIGSKEA